MNSVPLLSIVVPSKNRYEYLNSFVDAFISCDISHFELVIQDNSHIQNAEFAKKLLDCGDIRIKYNYNSEWLSVVDNCDLGVSHANGKYICMIGDDDGLVFSLVSLAISEAIKTNADAMIFNKAEYYWPDTKHAVWKDALAGKVFYKKYTGAIKEIDVERELMTVLSKGAATTLGKMPRIYHGIVKKEVLEKLHQRTGSYFPGPSPDMANSVGLSLLVKKLIEIDLPAVISGHGKKSTGGMGGEKLHHGRIEEQRHLPVKTSELWSECIPKFWSGATIYAESARLALERSGSVLKINYPYLWAFCLVFETNYTESIVRVVFNRPSEWPKVIYYTILILSFRAWNYGANYFFFSKKKQQHTFSVRNIQEAQIALHSLNLQIRRS